MERLARGFEDVAEQMKKDKERSIYCLYFSGKLKTVRNLRQRKT